MPDKKSYPLRISTEVLAAMKSWAAAKPYASKVD